MSVNNQNFIIGLISAITLVVGLISTIISIRKTNLEILKLQIENQKQKKVSSKKSAQPSHSDARSFSVNTRFIVEILFFLLFSISSVNTIIEYLSNRVPYLALVTVHFFVLVYSFILLIDMQSPPPNISAKEQRYFKVAGVVGMLIAITLSISLMIQRLIAISPTNNSIIVIIFSVIVNLEIAPLLAFSLVSLHRIIRFASNNMVSSQ